MDPEKRSRIMSAIKCKNTRPELKLRLALWRKGYRYRTHYGKEKIDIVFPSKKVAVFVDGCFWHQCPLHSHVPKGNKQYWGKNSGGMLSGTKKGTRDSGGGAGKLYVYGNMSWMTLEKL